MCVTPSSLRLKGASSKPMFLNKVLVFTCHITLNNWRVLVGWEWLGECLLNGEDGWLDVVIGDCHSCPASICCTPIGGHNQAQWLAIVCNTVTGKHLWKAGVDK